MTNFTRVFQPIPSWLNWPISFNEPDIHHHRLTNTIHLTLKMTSAQVVETSITNNSSFQNYLHPDDHTIRTTDTPQFKPFTMKGKKHKRTYQQYCNWSTYVTRKTKDLANTNINRNNLTKVVLLARVCKKQNSFCSRNPNTACQVTK